MLLKKEKKNVKFVLLVTGVIITGRKIVTGHQPAPDNQKIGKPVWYSVNYKAPEARANYLVLRHLIIIG
jgi:hypothetical protein